METENKVLFPAVKDGEIFTINGKEYIKFPEKDGMVPVLAKKIAFDSVFGEDNDLRGSTVLKKLKEKCLPEMMEAVGAENICTIRTDLMALSGQRDYGCMESLVSLPTLDFYREHVDIFMKHNAGGWWWLATPEAMEPAEKPWWILCVSPSGYFDYFNNCDGSIGVRPFYILKSSIFGSCED